MKTVIYLSMSLDTVSYGGSIVSRSNLYALKENKSLDIIDIAILRKNENIYSFELISNGNKFNIAINNILGYPGKTNRIIINKIKEIIDEVKPDYLYLDSSLLGNIAKWCKINFPHIKVITFFHNVEYDFELSRIKNRNFKFLPSVMTSIASEKNAVKYSDSIISLHTEDSSRLEKIYNRKADYLIPVCCNSDVDDLNLVAKSESKKFTIGFFGTAFFANIDAANYLANEISPHFVNDSDIEFIIAGNGFEKYKKRFSRSNVVVEGYQSSLSDFYKKIDVIISPIFNGAGMKVKISEALKYNKKIIASPFSLIGYQPISSSPDIYISKSISDFIYHINEAKNSKNIKANTNELFMKYYSQNACADYFSKVFID